MSKAFKIFFNKHPLIANSLIYGSLYVGAELSQQVITKKIMVNPKLPIDTACLARYGVIGTFVYPPTLFYWYKWLDRTFHGRTKRIIVTKLLLDQFIITPILLVTFFTGMALMEGARDTFAECRQKFLPTFWNSCYFWLPAQTINFSIIPPKYRIIYIGCCALVWINILCWIKRQAVIENVSKSK